MARGFVYLAAVIDWHSRKVLSWKLSKTLDSHFCVEALEGAIDEYGVPEIFNTDQGSQFTGSDFIGVLKRHGIQISMDGKGWWIDNVFIERVWHSVKYEEVYLKAYDSVAHARRSLANYFRFYNGRRRHQLLDRQMPNDVGYRAAITFGEELVATHHVLSEFVPVHGVILPTNSTQPGVGVPIAVTPVPTMPFYLLLAVSSLLGLTGLRNLK